VARRHARQQRCAVLAAGDEANDECAEAEILMGGLFPIVGSRMFFMKKISEARKFARVCGDEGVMTRMLIVLCTLLTVICLSSAQAEEPTVITLSCDGTTKVYVKREESINPVIKMGVVVNLAERAVSFDGRVARIDHVDGGTIFFGGNSVKDTTGYIDGKTGAIAATNMDGNAYYELVCPGATGAFSGLHDIAASDSGKVEITHQRSSYAGVSAHDTRKMRKAPPAPRTARPLGTRK
jgi:hypothetical protein